jgi:hypothetical protein
LSHSKNISKVQLHLLTVSLGQHQTGDSAGAPAAARACRGIIMQQQLRILLVWGN